jgi:hypothetical protein
MGKITFFPKKTSSDKFKLTYETKKKEKKLMSRLEPLCRVRKLNEKQFSLAANFK